MILYDQVQPGTCAIAISVTKVVKSADNQSTLFDIEVVTLMSIRTQMDFIVNNLGILVFLQQTATNVTLYTAFSI